MTDPFSLFRKDDFYLFLHSKQAKPLVKFDEHDNVQRPFRIPEDIAEDVPVDSFFAYRFDLSGQLVDGQLLQLPVPSCAVQYRSSAAGCSGGASWWQVALVRLLITNRISNGTDCSVSVAYNRDRTLIPISVRPELYNTELLRTDVLNIREDPDYLQIVRPDPLIPVDFTLEFEEATADRLTLRILRQDLRLKFNRRLADKLGFHADRWYNYPRPHVGYKLPNVNAGDQQINVRCPLIEPTYNGRLERVLDTFVKPAPPLAYDDEETIHELAPIAPCYHRLSRVNVRNIDLILTREDDTVLLSADPHPSDLAACLHFRRYHVC